MPNINYNITWDEAGKHLYETGVDHGVLYLQDADGAYPKGEAWNGLSAVTQSPSGTDYRFRCLCFHAGTCKLWSLLSDYAG